MGSKICLCMIGEGYEEESDDEGMPPSDDLDRGHCTKIVTTQIIAGSQDSEMVAKQNGVAVIVDQADEMRFRGEDTMYTISLASPIAETSTSDWYTSVVKLLDFNFS